MQINESPCYKCLHLSFELTCLSLPRSMTAPNACLSDDDGIAEISYRLRQVTLRQVQSLSLLFRNRGTQFQTPHFKSTNRSNGAHSWHRRDSFILRKHHSKKLMTIPGTLAPLLTKSLLSGLTRVDTNLTLHLAPMGPLVTFVVHNSKLY